ncbi:MAG: protein-methionine-sulfoxide reductase catalytic subunit MsrP, partial [Gammaproteobacteria bacterium]|nr:protein-methionine-sulfoxide reductase catalytic subunit MsrP [Gammaproteobacteria bacterium]
MLIRRPDDIRSSEITDEAVYLDRRRFMRTAAGLTTASALAAAAPGLLLPGAAAALTADSEAKGDALQGVIDGPFSTDEAATPYKDVTRYNNFYEFGTGKRDPAANSGRFKPQPWKVKILGECEKPGEYDLDDIIKQHTLEERIYRLRCVEAWSMVVPWVGVPLGPVLERFKPTSKAKYVAFRTVFRPTEMPGQQRGFLDWPYVEGLRMDEAMNPLTLLSVGVYGRVLPNQNGAPIRLVVPWKYGFKSI